METIRELFDESRRIDRRIEKVITYEATREDLLRREIEEYVATESIEDHFDRMLDVFEAGARGSGDAEIGVWVSGFYGSGKSSFTKYLGFALDPSREIDGKPFLEWLENRFSSRALQRRLATAAERYPAAVIMLDLASEQLAGASMAEITTVLHAKVMQWAGYSRDAKIAYLEFMLEKDGRMEAFKERVAEISKGRKWEEMKNQALTIKALASRVASEFYPELFPDARTFNAIRMEEHLLEDDRVRQILDLVKRKSSAPNAIFILDEVGQYVAARDDLITNLQGLAQNIKNIGGGRAWVIATAQQTLTEDDPRAVTNTAKLFKLKDRFPVSIDLEADDIQEICYRRLLAKSAEGERRLREMFERHGAQLRYAVELKETKLYKSDLDAETFVRLYPFLPQHFDILLQLLARLARSRGGVGLRSAIKVVQDILVDPNKTRRGAPLLADAPIGTLCTAAIFFDTLRADIQKPMPHLIHGVGRVEKAFPADSIHAEVAKAVAVLQILEDFPVSRENIAALLHAAVPAEARHEAASQAVDELLAEAEIPLTEVDGGLRFMSDKVIDLEKERLNIEPRTSDTRNLFHNLLKGIFSPPPSVRLGGTRAVSTGLKVYAGEMAVGLLGDKEPIQTYIEWIPSRDFEGRKGDRITESQQRANRNNLFLLAAEESGLDDVLAEVCRCREIYRAHRNKTDEKEVDEYLRAQDQRARKLEKELESRLKKALAAGAFVFRAQPRSVGEMGSDVVQALRKQLETVAEQVFEKYAEAPVQVESGAAEQFLKAEKLDKIPAKHDPLGLVQKGGGASPIDGRHRAILSVRVYLERQGQVEGRRLLDAFFAPPFGWSKDTTRYIVAAMLAAGAIKLRISGEDITVRGETAMGHLKNTNSFNKIGIALRDAPTDPENLLRARDRLLQLTGEDVMPLEEDISKCVMKHFPDFQQDYGSLKVQLENLELTGVERAQSVQDNLAEILKGDASDAANRLGGEECPLHEDLLWAREVKKAFDNGIGRRIREALVLLAEIPKLPSVGIPGQLVADTETERTALRDRIDRDDFYRHMADMQSLIAGIRNRIETAAHDFAEEQAATLESKKKAIRGSAEWALLGAEDRDRLGAELDALVVASATPDLDGLRKRMADEYLFGKEIERIQREMEKLVRETPPPDDGDDEFPGGGNVMSVSLEVPRQVDSPEALDDLIRELEALKARLEPGLSILIRWR